MFAAAAVVIVLLTLFAIQLQVRDTQADVQSGYLDSCREANSNAVVFQEVPAASNNGC